MTENQEIVVVQPSGSTRDQVIKLVVGALAGFVAGKLVEKAYDAAKERLADRDTDFDQ